MRCSKCGTENNDNAKFCYNCGSFLEKEIAYNNFVAPPQPKKNKKLLYIILPVASVLVFIAIICGLFSDSTSETKSKTDEDISIKYSGVITKSDIYTQGNTDYCIGEDGYIYKITENKKTTLSEQKKVCNFTIIDNEIYYMVEESNKKVKDEFGNDTQHTYCSCWKMKLDGSDSEKIVDSVIYMSIIYANENDLFLTGVAEDTTLIASIGHKLYKYNISSQNLSEIKIKNDNFGEYNDFTYVDGYILYTGAHSDPQSVPVYSYNINTDESKDLGFGASGIQRLNDTSVLMAKSGHQYNGKPFNPGLFEYNPKTNTKKSICENTDSLNDLWFFTNKNININDTVYIIRYSDSENIMYKYNSVSGLENLNIDSSLDAEDVFPVENGSLLLCDIARKIVFLGDDGTQKEVYSADDQICGIGHNVIVEAHFNEITKNQKYSIKDFPDYQ